MLSVLVMMVGVVSATTLTLENKDSTTWEVISGDGISGVLTYNAVGSEFVYSLTATGLEEDTDYSLIYYADPWPGSNPGAFIGTYITDGTGNLEVSETNVELSTMLPSELDDNFANGAKIWLVLADDYDGEKMIAWNPESYLFEDELIIYVDTDSPEACVIFVNPEADSSTNEDNLEIEWSYDCSATTYILQYKEGTCAGTDGWSDAIDNHIFGSSSTVYPWDISGLNEGDYCLKISAGDDRGFSGIFTIDRTSPIVSFTVSGDLTVFEEVSFDSTIVEESSGIASYLWDFGDSETSDMANPTHTYNSQGDYEVSLIVTDNAGNIGTFSLEDEDAIVISDIETEAEPFECETGILGIAPNVLDVEFDTGLTLTDCSLVPSSEVIAEVTIGFTGTNCEIDGTALIPYSERGIHNVVIRATDGTTILYYDVTISVYSWWIDLAEGWNLISIPMMPEDTSVDSVFGDITENVYCEGSEYTIFQYGDIWHKNRIDNCNVPKEGFDTGTSAYWLKNIVPGYGYYVKMQNADTLKGYGSIVPDIGGSLLSVEVANGWNLIGHYGLTDLNVTNALTSLVSGSIFYYDSVYTETVGGDMQTGEGYWMTAKFLPEETALYTPSQDALDSVL